ncbi:hypothetical protein PF003_g36957 [Phytophthora fragariae]|nr:hypothetical protein PF003_g36957 [Phytophthora fragariae]
MTQRQGSSNYTTSEMKCLLALVQSRLPASKRDWDLVAAAYNTRKEPRWKPRNAVSLTRKYRNMCLVANQVETELASTIRRVQTMMKKQKTPQTRAANASNQSSKPDLRRCYISIDKRSCCSTEAPPCRAAVFSPKSFRSA